MMRSIISNFETKKSIVLSLLLPLIAAGLLLNTGVSIEAANAKLDPGIKLLEEKQYDKALAFFDKSVDSEPTDAGSHFWRGKCLSALGKAQEAGAEFKLAALLSTDPELKESCKVELAKYKLPMPKGSVTSRQASHQTSQLQKKPQEEDDKLFKLSSKKLDWNLEMRKEFLSSMNEKNARLESLARGRLWRGQQSPPGNRAANLKGDLLEGPAHSITALSADERRALLASDVYIILDHSGSMQTHDCPSRGGFPESRLRWCVEELETFANDLASSFPHGYHLITFDNKPDIYQIRSASEFRQALESLKSGGGTDLALALKEAFRLHGSHPQQPLLIAVMSDAEIDLQSCQAAIVEATRRFPLPNGVFITLLQVGAVAELHTQDKLYFLDNLQIRGGAVYDAFFGIPFSKVRKEGLGRDLLTGLRQGSPQTEASKNSQTQKQTQKPARAQDGPANNAKSKEQAPVLSPPKRSNSK